MTRKNLLVLILVLLMLSSYAQAGGFHISTLGGRRTGMMAVVANPDDVTALFHNPAALADLPGTRLHLSNSISWLKTNISLKALDPLRFPEVNPPHCGEPGQDKCPWPINSHGYYKENIQPERYLAIEPFLGASHNLGAYSDKLKGVTVALAAYSPGAYGAFLPPRAPTAYYIIKGFFLVAAATAGVGWRIHDMIAIGASISYNYQRLSYAQRYSTVDLFTPRDQEPSFEALAAQALIGDLRLDFTGQDHGVGGSFGALFTPWQWLSIGTNITIFPPVKFIGKVTIKGLGSRYNRFAEPQTAKELAGWMSRNAGYKLPKRLKVEMPIPPAIFTGVSIKPKPWIEIGLDFRMWVYSIYKKQIITPIYDKKDPNEAPITAKDLSSKKNYSNSLQFAAGAMVRPFVSHPEIELMAGAGFDKSPVPNKTFSIDNPSLNQLIFTVGGRTMLGKHWMLCATYMHTIFLKRDVRHSQTWPPTNAKVSANSYMPTIEVEYLFN